MARKGVPKLIVAGRKALLEVMAEHLEEVGQEMVEWLLHSAQEARAGRIDIHNRLRELRSRVVDFPGAHQYTAALLEALGTIGDKAIKAVRDEVPNGQTVRLSDFAKLPAGLRSKLELRAGVTVSTQLGNLADILVFQYVNASAGINPDADEYKELRGDLRESLDEFIDGRSPEAAAGVLSAETVNSSRSAFFDDPDVRSQVAALEFVNEDPVTEICTDLAGTIFDIDDPDAFKYSPPLHFNCKSWIRPILAGELGDREITEIKPSSKAIADSIQFAEQAVKIFHG